MSGPTPNPEMNDLEAALANLTPAASPLNRDLVMFRAGQASRPRGAMFWPVATAVLAVTAAGLGASLALRPEPEPGVRVVTVTVKEKVQVPVVVVQAPDKEPEPLNKTQAEDPWRESPSTLRLREQVLQKGVNGLPPLPPDPGPEAPLPRDQELDSLNRGRNPAL